MESLDYDLVSETPAPLYMGELPDDYAAAPAPVIVNLCGALPRAPTDRTVLSLPMLDVLDPELLPQRERVEAFLAAVHVLAEQGPTYWHCHAGLNRSGFMVAAYLHLHRALPIGVCITTLRESRSPMVLCNSFFERTLRDWYGDPGEQQFQPFTLEMYLRERLRRRERGKE